jgi:hypothetical protein
MAEELFALVDRNGIELRVGDVLRDSRDGHIFAITGIDGYRLFDGTNALFWTTTAQRFWELVPRAPSAASVDAKQPEDRFVAGAYWEAQNRDWLSVIINQWDGASHFGFVAYSCGTQWGQLLSRFPNPDDAGLNDPRRYTYRGNIATAVESFLVALTRAVDGRTVPSPPPIEEPKTFAVCPRCGERMPDPQCGSVACRQVRRAVEARKAEEAAAAAYEHFDRVVREVVLEEAPRATVVTDFARHKRIGFVAWIECDGERGVEAFNPQSTEPHWRKTISARMALIREDLGAKAMGRK